MNSTKKLLLCFLSTFTIISINAMNESNELHNDFNQVASIIRKEDPSCEEQIYASCFFAAHAAKISNYDMFFSIEKSFPDQDELSKYYDRNFYTSLVSKEVPKRNGLLNHLAVLKHALTGQSIIYDPIVSQPTIVPQSIVQKPMVIRGIIKIPSVATTMNIVDKKSVVEEEVTFKKPQRIQKPQPTKKRKRTQKVKTKTQEKAQKRVSKKRVAKRRKVVKAADKVVKVTDKKIKIDIPRNDDGFYPEFRAMVKNGFFRERSSNGNPRANPYTLVRRYQRKHKWISPFSLNK